MDFVTPYAFTTTEALQSRLKRDLGAEDDVESRLRDAINSLTGWMERRTGRMLRARNHRASGSITVSAASGATAATTTNTANLEAGDELRGTGLAGGTQVDSITNGTAFVLTRPTTALMSSVSCTYGSRALEASGDGTNELQCPECPLVQVYGASWLDGDGSETALDLTGARYDYQTGLILLPNDVFPTGTRNIRIECRAGYEHPDDGGDWAAWGALEALSLRLGEIVYSDALALRGRSQDTSFASGSSRTGFDEVPPDVEQAIARFVRLW